MTELRHDEDAREFRLDVDGKDAVIRYEEKAPGVLDFYSTVVPEDRRGQGAGGRIVSKALDHLRENDQKVDPSCPFVSSFVEEHDEYRDLLVPS